MIASGLGDGFAEPIGRIFGKHKYKATALFSKEKFTRSYEGSACVLIFTMIGILVTIKELSTG